MEIVFYVAIVTPGQNIFQPTIVEKFDALSDASSYAALMCRAKKRNYIVLSGNRGMGRRTSEIIAVVGVAHSEVRVLSRH